jgi:large subunit ribosomal protein L30
MMAGSVTVTLRRSPIGTNPNQRKTLRSLGLARIGRSVQHKDTPAVRGMIRTVAHLVDTKE